MDDNETTPADVANGEAPSDAPGPGEGESVNTRRPRIGEQILARIDEVLDAVRSGSAPVADEGTGEDGTLPQVTFEPEEEQLPTTAEVNEDTGEPTTADEDSVTAQGEGTANLVEAHRPRFAHPSRRPVSAVDR